MKKRIFLLVMVLTVVAGAFAWTNRSDPFETAIRLEEDRARLHYPVDFSGLVDDYGTPLYVISPYPKLAGVTVGATLQALAEQQAPLEANQIRIVRGDFLETAFVGVRRLDFYESIYQKDRNQFYLLSSKRLSSQHVEVKTASIFNLNMLLSYYGAYVEEEVAKQLEGHPDKDRLLEMTFGKDPKSGLRAHAPHDDGFELRNGYIVFDTGLNVHLSKFYDVIDPSYLQGDDLEFYEAYLAEKEKR